jgi:hypothetical protein
VTAICPAVDLAVPAVAMCVSGEKLSFGELEACLAVPPLGEYSILNCRWPL